ncbi:hypothetical protein ACFWP2_35045 [Kitasatospora sp. NPDC058444]|uniref:hypothetical protein n=1 Tax=Kitasatospora sp. NPDC058444 TaxID=3346504 RepID=UPI00365AF1BC
MRVRMLVQISGTRNGQDWPPPGAVLDLPEAEALQLVAHRNAAVVEEQDDPEAEQDDTDPEGGQDDTDPEGGQDDTDPEGGQDDTDPEGETTEDGTGARRRGRPRLPRDAEGNIVRP